MKILDASEDIPESVLILSVELKLQNATQIPEYASCPKMYHVVDEFLRPLHESGLRVVLRVLVLVRLKTREDKFVFRGTRLRRCFQIYEDGRSYGKSSAWQLWLCRFEEVIPLAIDDRQRPIETVALGDEVRQNLDDDNIHQLPLPIFNLPQEPSFPCRVSLTLALRIRTQV